MSAAPDSEGRAGRIPLQKRWGQHHLRSGTLCRPLLEFLRPAGRLVAEIGPGGGVLTQQLLAAGASVLAVEIDPAWAFVLRADRRLAASRIVVGDALEIDWARFPPESLLAGNLPFNVATAIIERVLPHWQRFSRAAFMVQKEVGERLLANPGTRAYGATTVLARAWSDIERLGVIRRGSFRPPPKVDAIFLGFKLHRPPLAESEMAPFTDTVRLAFSQRRKQLRTVLQRAWGRERSLSALDRAGIAPESRAEALSVEDFVRLHLATIGAVPRKR